jgi:hypothetical protein
VPEAEEQQPHGPEPSKGAALVSTPEEVPPGKDETAKDPAFLPEFLKTLLFPLVGVVLFWLAIFWLTYRAMQGAAP